MRCPDCNWLLNDTDIVCPACSTTIIVKQTPPSEHRKPVFNANLKTVLLVTNTCGFITILLGVLCGNAIYTPYSVRWASIVWGLIQMVFLDVIAIEFCGVGKPKNGKLLIVYNIFLIMGVTCVKFAIDKVILDNMMMHWVFVKYAFLYDTGYTNLLPLLMPFFVDLTFMCLMGISVIYFCRNEDKKTRFWGNIDLVIISAMLITFTNGVGLILAIAMFKNFLKHNTYDQINQIEGTKNQLSVRFFAGWIAFFGLSGFLLWGCWAFSLFRDDFVLSALLCLALAFAELGLMGFVMYFLMRNFTNVEYGARWANVGVIIVGVLLTFRYYYTRADSSLIGLLLAIFVFSAIKYMDKSKK